MDILEPSTSADPLGPETEHSAFGDWLRAQIEKKGLSISVLAEKTGITYTGVWNIVKGNTVSPRKETRDKLAAVLNELIPPAVEAEIASQAMPLPGLEWVDFTPTDLETVPQASGVYVFYDITDRPVYVGKSSKNVRVRVKDHQTRFWFKSPLVVRGSFLAIPDPDLCLKIETILIKFLGKHALLNSKGVVRDE
ncbi:helix-turn-helix domain-containing protein [Rhizobium leguminosarum]|uniref:helix-turn-helix domain-containing protein n=1 Tax=Rhizobium leguminosarum TaxID=384 RepID=UPI00143F6CDC|nr:helix-turn-helix domain-containing protein [Rhizobium leguminosarum]NKL20715.1 helix-turn-helix domain-containing protein [Rhizobium leguminosarum bv. viciae]